MGCYVYMIQKGYGSIKIGVSKDPDARLRQLQTGNHGDLFIIAKFPFKSEAEARTMENELHKKFRKFRLNGEWFKKGILREFKHKAQIFPNIFRQLNKGESLNSYHEGYIAKDFRE